MNRQELNELRAKLLRQINEGDYAAGAEEWLDMSYEEVDRICQTYNSRFNKAQRLLDEAIRREPSEEEYAEASEGFATDNSSLVGYSEIMFADWELANDVRYYVYYREDFDKEDAEEKARIETAEAYKAKKETKTFRKFELGDISDVFVKKVKGGYHVSVCGEYCGEPYQEQENIHVKNEDVNFKSQFTGIEKYEVAARLGFFFMGFSDSF